ncbi:phage virion morphogenesis protein [Gimesia maris]|uniref:phage virion morphogenesis protein n=1 Tax=Gimesia maris TaxID=122 RepID=UPI003A92342B
MSKTITAKELGGFLSGIVRRLESPQASKVLSEWNDELAGDLAQGFLNSHSPDGVPWAPLKNPRPPGHNPGTRPLIDFGDLIRSVVSNGQGHIEIITDDSTTFGTSIYYASVHQYGSKDGSIPARPFLGIPGESLDKAVEMLSGHLITIIDAI